MTRLPVLHKTKLNKDQTYFINADGLTDLLSHSPQKDNVVLTFSDDPTAYKSNYDRFVKKERKLVVASINYSPEAQSIDDAGTHRTYQYVITIYAQLKAVREDLIAQFEKGHYATLAKWIDGPRDNVWHQKKHSLLFLIDIDTEVVEVAHDIDFDDYQRHSHKQKFRGDVRRH